MQGRSTLVLLFAGGLGLAAWALGLFDPPTAHIAALVPDDAPYAVVSSSLNDLRQAYKGKYAARDSDPAQARFGDRVNVPGLEGFDFERPIGYFSQGGKVVYVVPFLDQGAFDDAHAEERANMRAKDPVRVAKHYLSVSSSDAVATVGPDNRWILEASQHPLAVVGRPVDNFTLRAILVEFFGPDPMPDVRNAFPIAHLFAALPTSVGDPIAGEIEQMRLALPKRDVGATMVRFDLRATPTSSSQFARAADLAAEARVAELLGFMPAGKQMESIAGIAAVLDGEGWKSLGLPVDVGTTTAMFGLVSLKYRAGRHVVVLALAPTQVERLDAIEAAPAGSQEREVDGQTLRIWKLSEAPAPFAKILASRASSTPALYACTARAADAWFCTVGAHAEEVMRAMLRAASGNSEKSLRNLVGDENRKIAPTRAHGRFFDGGRLALGFITAQAQRALQFPLPYIPMASIGQPEAITFTLAYKDGLFQGDLRCFLATGE